ASAIEAAAFGVSRSCVDLTTGAAAAQLGRQYVARPPDKSNTPPVVNEQSSVHSHATSAAASSTLPNRPIGIFDSMYWTCCGVICRRISVSITAGVTQLTRTPRVANSLPSALV